jgi:hypothetical protein
MRICLYIILVLIWVNVYSQNTFSLSKPGTVAIFNENIEISKIPAELYIKNYVEKEINEWQVKDEFEKTSDYKIRVNNTTRQNQAQIFANKGLEKYKEEYAKTINLNNLQLGSYDADNETFLIHSDDFGDFALPVDIETAQAFKSNWNKVRVQNIELNINAEEVQLAKLEFVNPENNKVYKYNSQQKSTYAFEGIVYNFGEVDYDINLKNDYSASNTKIENRKSTIGSSDVDINIPQTESSNPNAFALIIGNEDYKSYQTGLQSEQNVYYAVNDAQIFKKYCEETLGIPRGNIIFVTNAGFVRMTQAFNQIQSVIKNSGGESEILIYYAGHGFPDEQTKEPYLIPVDVTGSNLDMAISLKDVYKKLTAFSSKKVVVFLDACFSGGGRDAGLLAARSVKVKPKAESLIGNIVVFAASTDEQSSLPYHDKQHGIFTYYLLKKLQETKGDVNLGELDNYLDQEVSVRSPLVNAKDQNPQTLVSPLIENEWKDWRLK